MNYMKIYDSLMNRAKNRILTEYYEKHHIIPRCLGGSNNKENIVCLTPEEHYIAHQLLSKQYPHNNSLLYAAIKMCQGRNSNKLYGWLRRKLSKIQSKKHQGNGNNSYGKVWITNGVEIEMLPEKEALEKINFQNYILGRASILEKCGHIVRKTGNKKVIKFPCLLCKNKIYSSINEYENDLQKEKLNCYIKNSNNARKNKTIKANEKYIKLFQEFKESEFKSVTQFAKFKNTHQSKLSALWKKYVTEYRENRQQGKPFLKE